MTLQTDLETAVAQAQADSDKLKDIVNGPESGTGSMVTVDSGDVKSVARAIAEIGDVSNQAIKDLSNVDDGDFASKASSAGVGPDGKVYISGDDTTAGNLEAKLLAGTGLSATTQNDGANETRTLAIDTATTPQLNEASQWTKAQNFDATTLTDAATIVWDTQSNQVTMVTLGGNRTMGPPTNPVDGGVYVLGVCQDGTGGRTLSWNGAFKFPAGTAPPLTTTANAKDFFSFISDGTNLYLFGQSLDVK
jgi:hypothetical protein